MATRYRIYPTLVNTFALYQSEVQNTNGQPYVDFEEMINRINRVPVERSQAQARGVNFEDALIKNQDVEDFPAEILTTMRSQLPPKYKSQVYLSCMVKDVEIYGFVDILGSDRAIDIKTTAKYKEGKFETNHQNLYLLGLKKYKINRLDYLITDFEQIYRESYYLDSYNFEPLFEQLGAFTEFLEKNRKLITDKKIFKLPANAGIQTSLF
jgi:hypothetical protein